MRWICCLFILKYLDIGGYFFYLFRESSENWLRKVWSNSPLRFFFFWMVNKFIQQRIAHQDAEHKNLIIILPTHKEYFNTPVLAKVGILIPLSRNVTKCHFHWLHCAIYFINYIDEAATHLPPWWFSLSDTQELAFLESYPLSQASAILFLIGVGLRPLRKINSTTQLQPWHIGRIHEKLARTKVKANMFVEERKSTNYFIQLKRTLIDFPLG